MKKTKSTKKIVVIGGGTGTFIVLSGLKNYENLDISAVITMADSGGSNRVIRDEFGLLPTSDLRQCMVALASSEADETLRKLFTYRFENGVGISGMTFGNLFMAALTDINGGDQKKAIEETCTILGVKGNIIPVTFDKSNLLATYSNGKQILGESEIDEPSPELGEQRITNLEVFPKVDVNPDAIQAIKEADIIVMGPGDLYTSIISNIVIAGVADSIKATKAKIIYVMNIMTRFGQTNDFKASDFVNEITKYMGGRFPDFVLVNKDNNIPEDIIEKYKQERSDVVKDDLDGLFLKVKVIRKNLTSNRIYEKPKSDKLTRSLLRHDPQKLAKAILET